MSLLSVPPGFERAIQRGVMTPIVYGEIVNAVQSNPVSIYSQWNSATFSNHRTSIRNLDRRTTPDTTAFSMIEHNFPAVGGDPTQTFDAVNIKRPTTEAADAFVDQTTNQSYQLLHIPAGQTPVYDVTTIGLRLRRRLLTNAARRDFQLAVVDLSASPNPEAGSRVRPVSGGQGGRVFVPGGGQQIGVAQFASQKLSASVNAVGLSPTSAAEQLFTFTGLRMYAGRTYLLHLAGVIEYVLWGALLNRGVGGEESGELVLATDGSGQYTMRPVPGREMRVRLPVPCFSFDGTTLNNRVIRMDMGTTPILPGWWEIDLSMPANTRCRILGRASSTADFSSDVTTLGASDNHTMSGNRHAGGVAHVHDGDRIPTLKRYYEATLQLFGTATYSEAFGTTPNTALGPFLQYTPSVFRIAPVFPVSRLQIASKGIPGIPDAVECIQAVPSIEYGLDLTTAFPTAKTWDLKLSNPGGKVSAFLKKTRLLGSRVQLWLAMEEQGPSITGLDQMAEFAHGTITTGPTRAGAEPITLRIEDATKSFELKLPRAKSGAVEEGDPVFEVVSEHGMDIIDRIIYSEARVPSRTRDDAWAMAKTAVGTAWVFSRRMTEPTDAREMVKQLLEHMGLYLTTNEGGRLEPIQYPRSGNAEYTFDDTDFIGEPSQGDFSRSICNECAVYSGYSGNGSQVGNEFFEDLTIAANEASQREFAGGGGLYMKQTIIKSLWIPPGVTGRRLAKVVATRRIRTLENGLAPITFDTNFRSYRVKVGSLVALKTRAYLRQYIDGTIMATTAQQKFLITKKTPNVGRGAATISWTAVEARDFNPPPTAVLAVSPTAITAPADVTFSPAGSSDLDAGGTPSAIALVEYDPDYDGHRFQPQASLTETDLTGVTWNYAAGSQGRKIVAVRITDVQGASSIGTAELRIRTAPVVEITQREEVSTSEPLTVILSAALSRSPSGATLDTFEWDLSYNANQGFVAEYDGVTVRLATNFQRITVALKVTDSDGLSTMVTLVIEGKVDSPPATVAALSVIQRDTWIEAWWPPNPEQDLAGYTVGIGVSGDVNFVAVHPEILTAMIQLPLIRPYTTTWLLAVRAIDTSGNESTELRTATIAIRDPGGRTSIFANDELSGGWLGEVCGLACAHVGTARFLHDLGAIENVGEFTEVDAGAHLLRVDTDRIEFASLTRQVNSYIYRDQTAGYYSDEFHFDLTFRITAISTNGEVALWGVGLGLGSLATQEGLGASGRYIALEVIESGGNVNLRLREWTGSAVVTSTAYAIGVGTTYHVRVGRNEQSGSAVMRFEVYSNAQRTTLLSSQTLTLASLENYRYLYGLIARNDGTAGTTVSGWTGKLWGDKAGAVQVTSAFTEVDPNSHLSASGHRFTFTGVHNDESCYFYWDRGVGFYDRDFSISFMFEITTATSGGAIGEIRLIYLNNSEPALGGVDAEFLVIRVLYNGSSVWLDMTGRTDYDESVFSALYVIATGTKYWCRFVRTTHINGLAFYSLHIYKDAERSHLLTVLVMHLGTVAFRFLRVVNSTDINQAGTTITGYVEQLWLTGLGRVMSGWYETMTQDVGSASQLAWCHAVPSVTTEITSGAVFVPRLPSFPEVESYFRAANTTTNMGAYTKRGLVVETVGGFVQARIVSKMDSPGRPQALDNLSFAADRIT